MSNICLSHLVLNAELVPDDPTTAVVFTDNDTEVTVTIPATAFDYQRPVDLEGNNYATEVHLHMNIVC